MSLIDQEPAVLPVYAALEKDGSITVEMLIAGHEDPSIVTIPATDETKAMTKPGLSREISLDEEGSPENMRLRAIVEELVARAERQVQQQIAEVRRELARQQQRGAKVAARR